MPSLEITPDGKTATVVVDGQDITELVSAYAVEHSAGQFPVATLQFRPGVDVEPIIAGHALIRVEVPEDPAEAMLRFLEPIDAEIFEQTVLDFMTEEGAPQSFGAAALAVLRGYANGD